MKTFLDVHYWCSFLTDATLLLILLVWLWVWLPPLVIRSRRLPKGALGMAFLNFIWIHENLGPRTSPEYQNVYRHEYVHIQQMRRYSPWGCALFLGGWYFWHCIVRRQSFALAWRNNPLERAAMAVMFH